MQCNVELQIAAPGNWQNGVPSELEESLSQIEMDPEYDAQNLRFPLSCSDYTVLTDKSMGLEAFKKKLLSLVTLISLLIMTPSHGLLIFHLVRCSSRLIFYILRGSLDICFSGYLFVSLENMASHGFSF